MAIISGVAIMEASFPSPPAGIERTNGGAGDKTLASM